MLWPVRAIAGSVLFWSPHVEDWDLAALVPDPPRLHAMQAKLISRSSPEVDDDPSIPGNQRILYKLPMGAERLCGYGVNAVVTTDPRGSQSGVSDYPVSPNSDTRDGGLPATAFHHPHATSTCFHLELDPAN